MLATLEGLPGLFIGHWTDAEAATGCTVLLFPRGAAAGVDVRGSAPGTRETAVLTAGNLVDRIHAVLLTGGSAYGLDAASGVMAWCEEQGVGFETPAGRVPIVVAAVLYDLDLGDPSRRPGPAEGRAACRAATSSHPASAATMLGNVGAGAGATVGKRAGPAHRMKGGLGVAWGRLASGEAMAAVVAVNAVGDVVDPRTGEWLAGAYDRERRRPLPEWGATASPPLGPGQATTLACVVTALPVEGPDLTKVATMSHDGIARAVRPSHTLFDGDAVFAGSVGEGPRYGGLPRAVAVSQAGALAADLVTEAIVAAVRSARGVAGVPSMSDIRAAQTR
ncbi:MAG: P1 family peptidase [Firmicutes bacterium]|nr:P1 family peptidase [Bacillota bacterium]